ncbi:RNA polymerase sigma-70 factor (ECF subfamily) [Nocardia transvalensis]|uniref:RNA polymerase sigma-70 factor (ECF subfamily) n=1 Tax=Nocardia transvalensis TaxID=37333 RepID=A0A7W9PBF3_9NOCA|nr:sigma-70 family RNA polymerase sigma factor [Nocardia transvalensis]MBB5913012.1 RNA polymerase sigma-70 factor (ECF subfamily) [Nocardia transvalensis]
MSDAATREFADHRELLFSIVYDMLGTVTDTEDVLQDTWLAWSGRRRPGTAPVDNPRAYLVRIAVNTALARQEAIARRRETYIGPWLPEPLLTGVSDARADAADETVRTESVSLAMLVVLESLTPLERAVFVLHNIFGYPHADIGEILGRGTAAVRQLAHRAREHVHARRPRHRTDPRLQRAVTEKFLAVQAGGDLAELLALLAPDVTFWTDTGGAKHAARRPIQGADKVARLLTNPTMRRNTLDLGIAYGTVNGDPAAVVSAYGAPFAVLVLDIDPGTEKIRGIYAVANRAKLGTIGT